MISLDWQRTFDGATPRLVEPTLASGEHGAPVQGLGLVVKATFAHANYRPGGQGRVVPGTSLRAPGKKAIWTDLISSTAGAGGEP
jgi:hypothetical protein